MTHRFKRNTFSSKNIFCSSQQSMVHWLSSSAFPCLVLTQFHLIPSSTKSYWPSITKYQPESPHTDPAPPNTNQYRLLITQYYHVPTKSASYWPINIIYQLVLPYTDTVPPSSTSTAFYWPRPTKYRPVTPCTDLAPSYINQYNPILTQNHQVPNSTALYWPSSIMN